MTAAIVVAVLAIAALVYVVAPLGRRDHPLDDAPSENAAEENKRVALTGILDLEEERDAGKLSDDEFEDLRIRYERDAIAALRRLETTPGAVLEDRLEREIADAREKLRCRTCGAPRGSSAARCPSCGSSY
ncbi:MAG: hypothetical protein KY391_06415 [Actinobacteria bacterium]|nr:hypothetical protein [Actinomycetota bacterium]